MPGFNGTGPLKKGPMTGGGRGYCAIPLEATEKRTFGQGMSFKIGGRGNRNCFYATGLPGWMRAQNGIEPFKRFAQSWSKEDQLAALKNQVDYLNNTLGEIQSRIQELEGKKERSL